MEIRKTREFSVKMGDYETFKFGATVMVTHHDVGVTTDDLADMSDKDRGEVLDEMTELLLDTLDDQLVDDVRDAQHLSENKRSFILKGLDNQRDRDRRSTNSRRN